MSSTAAMRRTRQNQIIVASTITFIAGTNASLLTPTGVVAMILAPLAVLACFIGGYALGLPWLLGWTDADPDEYSMAWWLPFIIIGAVGNAALYLGLAAAWHMRGRRRRY